MPDDEPPRLILGLVRPVTLARLLLVFLPLVPGLIFFVVGFLVDPLWPAQDPPPEVAAAYARDAARCHQIYQAAAVTLLGGSLGTLAVLWKIVRPRPEESDPSQDDRT